MYFNIQRFSTHDGDGIRSILFLKGCTLACSWCQNPESRSEKRSLLFDPSLCLSGCSACLEVSSAITRDHTDAVIINRPAVNELYLDRLKTVCPTKALSVCGEQAHTDLLCEQLLKDKPFYIQSDGGVTFSGGEPLMQAELVRDIAQRMHQEGINTAVETCMHVPWKNIESVLPYIDCWLTDLKHTDAQKFKLWAKGSLSRIKNNFQRLAKQAKRLVIRVPVVPGFNDTRAELQEIVDFAVSLESCSELHLLPYHTLGSNKYNLLDIKYLCSDKPLNNPELLADAQLYAQNHPLSRKQFTVKIRG
ncbi:glycyl-radical enzyme activating protein [Psychromonas aquimarina]|uniref:glycyl-radical enzyme activating protein n=1 Tax=Psychromonas aquimarina TaxID=444919 RepID=UPI0004201713|nr:glycyl-radical enzyme activating protein [Psychromonas aquimarina]